MALKRLSIVLVVLLFAVPASNAQIAPIAGGALSGLGTLAAAKQMGDYIKGLEEALEEMRARAIADSNLAMAQRIDQLTINSQILLDNINADATTQIATLNADTQAALDQLRKTVQLFSDNVDATAQHTILQLDQAINGFCQHSLLCKPVYAITSVKGTVLNLAAGPMKPILVSGTALVEGASVTVVVNKHTLGATDISAPDPQSRAITIPPDFIPPQQYGVVSYPISITISGTIDNPDRSGWSGWKFWKDKRIPKQLTSLVLSIYVLPKIPASASVAEYAATKRWVPCQNPNNCIQKQIVNTSYKDVQPFPWPLATDRALGSVIDWPGNVNTKFDQRVTTNVSGDWYAFICTTPREVDSGGGIRRVESTCLDAILWDENAKHCGPHVFDLIHSNDQQTRDSAVEYAIGCTKVGKTNRVATFSYSLLASGDPAPNRIIKGIENATPNPTGTFDLGYGSYCSEQLGATDSAFSVWVTPRLAKGSAPATELTPNSSTVEINNTAVVSAKLESNPPKRCVRITVSPPQ